MDTKKQEWLGRQKTLLTPDEEVLHKAEVFSIVGAAMAVLNELGHGLHEKPYENALVVEFRIRGIRFEQQPSFQITYKGHQVGLYIPDLVAFGLVVVDAKVI